MIKFELLLTITILYTRSFLELRIRNSKVQKYTIYMPVAKNPWKDHFKALRILTANFMQM